MPQGLFVRRLLPILGIALLIAGAMMIALLTDESWRWAAIILVSLAVASLLMLAHALVHRWRYNQPLIALAQITARMTNGDWSERAEPAGASNVRQMGNHLNLLAAQVQKQLSDLQQQRGGLRALMDTMPDPILAADAQGRIVLLNTPAAQLLSVSPAEVLNQKLVSVVNDEKVVELYEALAAVGPGNAQVDSVQREIRLARGGQRFTFQAIARRMASGSSLLVLRDVSALAGAVQMKTDFVANASHELRTPIAAIKIAFETMREVYKDEPSQTERCISVIDAQIRRLEEMLRDLLDLSRVESSEDKSQIVEIKTSELLSVLKATLGTLAREKNVDFRIGDEDPACPPEIFTDARLFNLVLKNLVENSIKFTPPDGKVAVVIRRPSPQFITVAVTDTGIGIAHEHADRVFERFYQVDPARSGSAGRGSGLGLAIVKHAVAAMEGTVKLESTVGSGTTITCQFPQPAPTVQRPAPATESAVA